MLLLLSVASASAPCPAATTAALNERLNKAELAFAKRDENAVRVWTDEVRSLLPCLRTPVAPVDVARLYTTLGLYSYLGRERDQTQRWFEAARGVKADLPFPDVGLPSGHELPQLYDGVTTRRPGVRKLLRPLGGYLLVDGEPSTEAPIGRPWLFQRADATGAVVATQLLDPDDPLPVYPRPRRAWATVGGGLWHYPNGSDVTLLGATTAAVGAPITGPVDLVARGVAGIHGTGVVPGLELGARWWLATDGAAPHVGLALLTTVHGDGGTIGDDVGVVVRPAIGVPLGLRWPLGAVSVDVDAVPTLGPAHDEGGLRVSTRVTAGLAVNL
jgi:hypothetical protein